MCLYLKSKIKVIKHVLFAETVIGINTVSEQLGIDSKKLEQVLLHRSIHSGSKARRSMFVKPIRMEEANSRRDCLAMLLYSKYVLIILIILKPHS